MTFRPQIRYVLTLISIATFPQN